MAEDELKARARRDFVNAENLALGRFLGAAEQLRIVGWGRSYQCDCGFACRSPGAVFGHVRECGGRK